MSNRKPTKYPDYVLDNMDWLFHPVKGPDLANDEIAEIAHRDARSVGAWMLGISTPTSAAYNRLAEHFGWERWEPPASVWRERRRQEPRV